MGRRLYGFISTTISQDAVISEEATHLKLIYKHYLSGFSLERICDYLADEQIISPSGKERWTRASINKILSNKKYVPYIIDADTFARVQNEKKLRCNIDNETGTRKTTRYNSQNVLSGLLFCSECRKPYRRYTRGDGSVVWRCANRVEHGKRCCKHSPSVPEDMIKNYICKALNTDEYIPTLIKENFQFIEIKTDHCFLPIFRN